MIYEVRIFSRIGSSIYASEINITRQRIETQAIERPTLFSSMMSAILSFDSEVGRTPVREFIYENNKAVLHFLDEIAFLVYADSKVRNKDLEHFLEVLANKWLKDFEDREYMMLDGRQHDLIEKKVNQAISEVFWWVEPYPSAQRIFNIGITTLTRPNSTYYIRYLSNYYHILSVIFPIIAILLAYYLGVVISGFTPRTLEQRSLITVAMPILILWLGPGLFLEALFGEKFNLRGYYTISGILTFYLLPVILLSSQLYFHLIISTFIGGGILTQILEVFLLLVPLNIFFFGYFLTIGFAASFANDVNQGKFLISYAVSLTILISMTSILAF